MIARVLAWVVDRLPAGGPASPAAFPEQNFTLTGHGGVGDLPAWKGETPDGKNVFISAWDLPFWDRVRVLLTGRLYLGVQSGFHPPVWIHTEAFVEGDPEDGAAQERKVERVQLIRVAK